MNTRIPEHHELFLNKEELFRHKLRYSTLLFPASTKTDGHDLHVHVRLDDAMVDMLFNMESVRKHYGYDE